MNPTHFRDLTFAELQSRLGDLRLRVFEAWRRHGPGTTRAMAAQAGIDLLTFRPRTTELVQLGLVMLAPADHPSPSGRGTEGEGERAPSHEGVYQARTLEEFTAWRQANQQLAISHQQQLI